MFCAGFFIEGPLAKFWYIHVQPYYMNKLLPKLFPKFYKNPSLWKIAITSCIIDCFIGDWLYMSLLIFFGGFWET